MMRLTPELFARLVTRLNGMRAVDPDRLRRDEDTVRRGFWDKMRGTLGRVPFAGEAVAAYYAALDPKTPLRAKAILLAALAYFILPFDLVPDMLAGLGFTDDLAVLVGAIKSISGHVTDEHRRRARETLGRGDLPRGSSSGDGPSGDDPPRNHAA